MVAVADLTWTRAFTQLPIVAVDRPVEAKRHAVSLSIVVPVYNEERTVRAAVTALAYLDLPCPYEVIVVDDGSDDATAEILRSLVSEIDGGLRISRHDANRGKGAAVLTGLAMASGTHLLVFDADLEYSAADIVALVAPVVDGRAEVVYGRRDHDRDHAPALRYHVGNVLMTKLARLLFRSRVADIHTCLKLVPVALLRRLVLTESGFGLDTQITVGLLCERIQPHEVPVTYRPRSRAEGKKIGWRDGMRCVQLMLRMRISPPLPAPTPALAFPATHEPFIDLRAQEPAVA